MALTDTSGWDGLLTITGGTWATTTETDPTLSTWAGSTNLTILGTIATGTWNGIAIADGYVDNDLTISEGTINNTPIGATTPSTAVFTNATTTNLTVGAYTLPTTDGANGQVLKTNGSGILTWLDDSGVGNETDPLFTAMDTEAELETQLSNVSNVFTNNDTIQDAYIADDITLTNITQITNRDIASTTGTLDISSRTNLATSGPITLTDDTIGINQASLTADGYLSSTDWTTFNSKEGALTASTTFTYYRGDKTWQTLDTSVVTENGNLYYTDALARNAVSETVLGLDYATSTGELSLTSGYNIPLTTLFSEQSQQEHGMEYLLLTHILTTI
ncbi:hypothetical protein KJ978_03695 [Patescibacteria group bacterium]|nr:hypothetical protein [Patescibacteria group bacterium]MBU2416365.1 hypothetical protein [Patescibacteria group bacterium]